MTVRILTGDCREVLRTLEDESVHCVVTSPRAEGGRFAKGVHAYREPKPHWRRDWLVYEYEVRERSAAEIAAEIGCTENNVLYWLKKHAIPRRSVSQARAVKHWGSFGSDNPMFGRIGAASPSYVDGSAPERQRLYVRAEGRKFLQRTYARDGFRCVRCAAPKAGPRSLHVHHLKPWAGNHALRFDDSNVVTLCRCCHHWVHSKANVGGEYLA